MRNAEDLLFNFKKDLHVRGRSKATVKHYSHHIRHFMRAMDGKDIKAVTKTHIETYIESLYRHKTREGAPYTLATIGLKIRAIKRLFEYLESINMIFINPAESIKEPQKDKHLPRHVLTPKQIRAMLDQPNLGLMTGIRDRAILEVFYSTGIRMAELCGLTVFDADLTGGMLRVNNGKGGKDRVVPLGRHAVKALREYITKVRVRQTRKNRKERHLFIGRYGKAICPDVVSRKIRAYAEQAGIKQTITAHCLRHTFATALVKNGADITAVQKMLGHTDIRSTQQYIRTLGLPVKAVHKKTHPRERDKAVKESIKPQIKRIKAYHGHNTVKNPAKSLSAINEGA